MWSNLGLCGRHDLLIFPELPMRINGEWRCEKKIASRERFPDKAALCLGIFSENHVAFSRN